MNVNIFNWVYVFPNTKYRNRNIWIKILHIQQKRIIFQQFGAKSRLISDNQQHLRVPLTVVYTYVYVFLAFTTSKQRVLTQINMYLSIENLFRYINIYYVAIIRL